MFITNRIIVALLAGVSVSAFASLASAAISPARYAAIEKCTQQALAEHPDTTISNQSQRSSVYEACMTEAGQTP